jgi:hypothetical protein
MLLVEFNFVMYSFIVTPNLYNIYSERYQIFQKFQNARNLT